MNSSQTECETFCTNRNERIPSVLDFDFGNMDFKSILKLYDPDKNARPSIWTDGKFDYKIQKWLDKSGEPIPDGFWEKSVWLRKAYFIPNFMIHMMKHIIWSILYAPCNIDHINYMV